MLDNLNLLFVGVGDRVSSPPPILRPKVGLIWAWTPKKSEVHGFRAAGRSGGEPRPLGGARGIADLRAGTVDVF
jgi:hypothetical protein